MLSDNLCGKNKGADQHLCFCICKKQASYDAAHMSCIYDIFYFSNFQLFLHKVFSYRGVILYPWMAKVFDRDKATKTEVK